MTEWQRRLLADPYRLEGEGEVAWELRPELLLKAGLSTVTGGLDPRRVDRLAAELERGLRPISTELLQWLCDKLVVLPTQNGSVKDAAYWTDNVFDVCEHYAEDLLQAATLEILKTRTFRPSPAEIVAIVEPRHAERRRMLERVKSLNAPKAGAAGKPFVAEPLEVRLRTMRDGFRRVGDTAKAAKYERDLAVHENRDPDDWAAELQNCANVQIPASTARPPFVPPTSPSARRCADLARAQRTGQPAPEYRDVPEGA